MGNNIVSYNSIIVFVKDDEIFLCENNKGIKSSITGRSKYYNSLDTLTINSIYYYTSKNNVKSINKVNEEIVVNGEKSTVYFCEIKSESFISSKFDFIFKKYKLLDIKDDENTLENIRLALFKSYHTIFKCDEDNELELDE